ncbi:hypothetical protein AAY473_008313 [Plecturocebus cupreus]
MAKIQNTDNAKCWDECGITETLTHYWAGLKLLALSNPPTSASKNAGITGHFGRPRQADHLRSRVGDEPDQYGRNPVSTKDTKTSQAWPGRKGRGAARVTRLSVRIVKFWLGAVPHTCNASKWQADHLRSGVGDQPGQHAEIPSLLKTQKVAKRDGVRHRQAGGRTRSQLTQLPGVMRTLQMQGLSFTTTEPCKGLSLERYQHMRSGLAASPSERKRAQPSSRRIHVQRHQDARDTLQRAELEKGPVRMDAPTDEATEEQGPAQGSFCWRDRGSVMGVSGAAGEDTVACGI